MVQNVVTGDFCVKFHLKSKSDGFMWIFVVAYGAAQDNLKPDFLAELVRICEHESLPMLVGVISILFVDRRKRIIPILMRDGLSFSMPLLKV